MLPAFVKDFASVSLDTISNNIIESALGCLQCIGAFVEEGFFELVVIVPGGVSRTRPPVQGNDLSDIYLTTTQSNAMCLISSSSPQWGHSRDGTLPLKQVPTGRAWLQKSHMNPLTLE